MKTRGYLAILLIVSFQQLEAQTNPIIKSFTPSNNALNVAENTNITVTFETDINSTTINNNTIRIHGSISGLHTCTFDYNSSTYIATITPNASLYVGEVVTVILTSGIKSANGDSLSGSYSWQFTIKTNTSSGFFQLSSVIGVGDSPWYMAAGDFNKDSAIDLATVNNSSNNISILRNNGTGSFTLASTIAVGNNPGSITAADLNNDGFIDLAVTNSGSGTVSLLLNNGNETFTRSDIECNGIYPWNIATLDVDGNGDLDLAVANYGSNKVSILKNNGNGTFVYSSSVNVDVNPYALATLDLEGDGVMDIAVANYGSNTVSILRNNGNGIFTQISSINVGNGPVSILAVNIDGDNAADLVISNNKDYTISILKNNGTGEFSTMSTDTIGTHPVFSTATDIDGDGAIDLIVPGIERITVLKNNGTGVFVTNSIFNIGTGNITRMVVAADLDNDGQIDFAGVDQLKNSLLVFKIRPQKASIRLSHNSLNFGVIASGINQNLSLKIFNDGTDSSLVISNIVSSNSVFTVDRSSFSIAPLTSDSISVTFSPTIAGTIFNDTLILTTNDTENPVVKIFLSGSATFNQPKVEFIINLNGPIYAGISILGNNSMYAIASGDAVYKMNTNGQIIYTLQVGGEVRSSSSISYDTTVYIASSDCNLYAFSKSGNSVWSPIPTGGTLTATPTVDSISNCIYIGVSNKNFIAVNRTTGSVVWNYFADAPINNSAVITKDKKNDRRLIFASQKGTLYGFDLKKLATSVSPTWEIALPDTAPSSFAVDDQSRIYVGTGSGKLIKIALPVDQQPSILWEKQIGSAITGSPVIDANGILYVGTADSNLYAVDIQSGDVKWSFATKAPIRSTPAISPYGIIYVANDSGEVYALDSDMNVRWYYKTQNAIVAPLLYYNSKLYLGTLGNQIIALFDSIDAPSSKMNTLSKLAVSKQVMQEPIWATYQGNNQRTGIFSSTTETGIKVLTDNVPINFALHQNYPNPFNPSTIIQYDIPNAGRQYIVSLRVYDVLGKEVATLVNQQQEAGSYEVSFNASNLASGIYFYKLQAGNYTATKKLLLIK